MSRGMFGWDLPPGCSVNDIPGNRPEDIAAEEISMGFWEGKDRFEKEYCSKELWDKIDSVNEASELVERAIQYGIEIGEKRAREDSRWTSQCVHSGVIGILRENNVDEKIIEKIEELA